LIVHDKELARYSVINAQLENTCTSVDLTLRINDISQPHVNSQYYCNCQYKCINIFTNRNISAACAFKQQKATFQITMVVSASNTQTNIVLKMIILAICRLMIFIY